MEIESFIPEFNEDLIKICIDFINFIEKNDNVNNKLNIINLGFNKKLNKPHIIILFFIIICWSFKKSFKSNKEINNSYTKSSYVFLSICKNIKNLIIINKKYISDGDIKKIRQLTQVSLEFFTAINFIEKKANYDTKNKKLLNYYKMIYSLNYRFCFEIEYKFFRNKPIIIYFEEENKKKERIRKSIISGPTFLRSFEYNKTMLGINENFYHKDKLIEESYIDTKYYPDLEYIKILKNKFYSDLKKENILKEIEIIRIKFEETFKNGNIKEEDLENRSLIQAEYSKKFEKLKICIFLEHNWSGFYYVAHKNDSRGRKYYISTLFYTDFRLSRYCFHYGYDKKEINDSENFSWEEYNYIIKDLNLKKLNKECIFMYLISIGKFKEDRKNNIKTSLKDILEFGYKTFENEDNFLYIKNDYYITNLTLKESIDIIELEYYLFSLKMYIEGDKTKRVIIKDATASGYQLQGALVGISDIDKLKYLNIGNTDEFFDTYIFIIESYIKHINQELPYWSKKYFNRKYIKKFCMIIPYSAGFEECFENIKEFIDDKDIIKMNNLLSEFYNFIKNDLWKYLGFNKPFKEHINTMIKNENFTESTINAFVSFKYNKIKDEYVDIKFIDNMGFISRTTRKLKFTTNEVDDRKTKTALAPNLVHFYDSEIIRWMHSSSNNLKFASIHDAFICPNIDCGIILFTYGLYFKINIGIKFNPRPTTMI